MYIILKKNLKLKNMFVNYRENASILRFSSYDSKLNHLDLIELEAATRVKKYLGSSKNVRVMLNRNFFPKNTIKEVLTKVGLFALSSFAFFGAAATAVDWSPTFKDGFNRVLESKYPTQLETAQVEHIRAQTENIRERTRVLSHVNAMMESGNEDAIALAAKLPPDVYQTNTALGNPLERKK